tara:strand:+ start:55 stop:300 length:246 start_codon:yes stop_codon:yes gene_type:complete
MISYLTKTRSDRHSIQNYPIYINDPKMEKMKINMILYENNYTHDLFYNDKFITSLIINEKSTKKILKEFLKEYFKGLKEMF